MDHPNKDSRYALWHKWQIVLLHGCQASFWENFISLQVEVLDNWWHLDICSSFRDKFFLNLDYSHDVFERNKVQRFYKLYGREILQKYRKSPPTESKYKNAPTFREFIDYLLDLPLRRLDSHWLPTYFQCMPCHIKYSILGRYDMPNMFSHFTMSKKSPDLPKVQNKHHPFSMMLMTIPQTQALLLPFQLNYFFPYQSLS